MTMPPPCGLGNSSRAMTRATRGAGPGAAAAALADGAQVAEADGALAGAAAAATGASQAEAADAVRLANLIADEAAEHVFRIVAERGVAAEDRRDVGTFLTL